MKRPKTMNEKKISSPNGGKGFLFYFRKAVVVKSHVALKNSFPILVDR